MAKPNLSSAAQLTQPTVREISKLLIKSKLLIIVVKKEAPMQI